MAKSTLHNPEHDYDFPKLRKAIIKAFSDSEIRTICFDLDIEYENLEAIGKAGKVRELITYCRKTSNLSELMSCCANARPNINWNLYKIGSAHKMPKDARKEEPIFSNDMYPNDFTFKMLLSHLNEWKIIHTNVQNLLFSTQPLALRMERNLTEESVSFIEDDWYRHCEPRTNKFRVELKKLTNVNHHSLNHLQLLLATDSELYIVRCIWDLEIGNKNSEIRLKSAFYDLVDTLKEVLTVADVHILFIAEQLINKQ